MEESDKVQVSEVWTDIHMDVSSANGPWRIYEVEIVENDGEHIQYIHHGDAITQHYCRSISNFLENFTKV